MRVVDDNWFPDKDVTGEEIAVHMTNGLQEGKVITNLKHPFLDIEHSGLAAI